MRRAGMAFWMLVLTTAAVAVMLLTAGREAEAAAVRMAVTTSGSIRNTAAISGRVVFLEERVICAEAPGLVENIYVETGDRVAAGSALMRLETSGIERAVSAWAGAEESVRSAVKAEDLQLLLESAVIRTPVDGTVRQVLTAQSGAVAAGTPVAVISSAERAVVCQAAEADARRIRPGMQADLTLDGEYLCSAEVTEVGDVTADALTGRMQCSITLKPAGAMTLPAGTAVDADVCISHRENVTILPLEAITPRDTVWWVHDGRCTEIPAEIVLSDELHAWVRLPEGMQVAIGEMEEGKRVTEVQP